MPEVRNLPPLSHPRPAALSTISSDKALQPSLINYLTAFEISRKLPLSITLSLLNYILPNTYCHVCLLRLLIQSLSKPPLLNSPFLTLPCFYTLFVVSLHLSLPRTGHSPPISCYLHLSSHLPKGKCQQHGILSGNLHVSPPISMALPICHSPEG
jgi:hypothetical protein